MNTRLKENWIQWFFLLGIYFFAASLVFKESLRNITIMIFGVSVILNLIVRPQTFQIKPRKSMFLGVVFFMIMLISLAYTQDMDFGSKRVSGMIALGVLPLAFYTFHRNYNLDYKRVSLNVYKLFFVATVLFLIGVAIHNYLNGHFNQYIFRDYAERLNTYYGTYSMHPLYMSMYLSICLFFSIPIYKSLTKLIYKVFLLLGVLLITTILIVLARKGVIAVTFVIFLVYFLRTKKKKSLILYGLISLVLMAIAYNIPEIKNRFLEFINTFLNKGSKELGSTSIRLSVYDCVIEAIKGEPLFGYGIGDTKSTLNECYDANYNVFNGKFYNAHNQFLSAWLAAGLIGITTLIIWVVSIIKRAFQKGDFVHIAVITVLCVSLLTENILERQSGVLLFAFFVNFFTFKTLCSEETKH